MSCTLRAQWGGQSRGGSRPGPEQQGAGGAGGSGRKFPGGGELRVRAQAPTLFSPPPCDGAAAATLPTGGTAGLLLPAGSPGTSPLRGRG